MLEDIIEIPCPSSFMDLSILTQSSTQQQQQVELANFPYEASSLIDEIEKEIEKDQQGLSEEDVLHKILLKLEQSIIKESSGRAYKSDGLAFKKFSQLMLAKAANLKNSKENCLNMNILTRRLKEFAFDNDENDNLQTSTNAFVNIGNKLTYLLFKAPKYNYIKPCVPLTENLEERPKKERMRTQRQNVPTQVIVGKSTQEAKEETENENSVTKELDLVRRHLRLAWKNNSTDKDSIDYYRFVLHPKNFGESIENMFYVSFLVKDGYVQLIVDKSTGLPMLKKLTREEKERISSVDRSALETTQFVTRIDYKIWKELVSVLKIDKPLIIR